MANTNHLADSTGSIHAWTPYAGTRENFYKDNTLNLKPPPTLRYPKAIKSTTLDTNKLKFPSISGSRFITKTKPVPKNRTQKLKIIKNSYFSPRIKYPINTHTTSYSSLSLKKQTYKSSIRISPTIFDIESVFSQSPSQRIIIKSNFKTIN